MTTPTATRNQRSNNDVGDRIELGRYRTAAGVERVLYGQRIARVVRFLPGDRVVLDGVRVDTEDDICRSRGGSASVGRGHAVRPKRRRAGAPRNAGEAS